MFTKDLEQRIKRMFLIDKVTYDQASAVREQGCIFIRLDTAQSTLTQGRVKARVEGSLAMYSTSDKLPYGFFAKAIEKAEPELSRPFFFGRPEDNNQFDINLIERSVPFVFFYDSQHDPRVDKMLGVSVNIEEL